MKAITFHAGQKVMLEERPVPQLGPSEALVRVRAAGLCHTDIEILKGNYGASAFPLVPGHEVAGEVAALGAEVTDLTVGARVVINPNLGCGHCRGCLAGRINLCEALGAYGVTRDGGFAEYCAIEAKRLVPVGEMSFHLAALAEPMGCVINALAPLSGASLGRCLIFGAGPMGLLLARALRLRGAGEVTLVDRNLARLTLAQSLGLTTLPAGSSALADLHHACDLVVDATGVVAVAAGCIDYAANGGAVLFFGVCPSSAQIEIAPFEMFRRQLTLLGTHSLNDGDIVTALEVLRQIGPEIEAVVSHRLSLDQIAEIFAHGAPEAGMKLHFTA